uniref:Uncharacterized protein n=1 Tax=Tanacetum cinerariifolium TaxID=118510 RepID=A0A699HUG3_TANCI|nr:hypothetical protein [Tanacetum cinerariifolium]
MSTLSNTTFEFDVNHNGELKLNPLTYQHGSLLNVHVLQMDFKDMVSYLKWKIPRQFTTLYYMLPPNYALSGMKQIKNDYETNVMYDIAKVAGKLQIFVSHTLIDLSTVLIPNNGSLEESLAAQYKLKIYIDHIGVDFVISKYIFPNASLKEMVNHVITDYSSENEVIIRQETQNDYTFDKMVESAEQEHFEYKETKTSHTISSISIMLSSTIESCLSYTYFFSPLTYYMAFGANEARQAIVLKLQREIQVEETLGDQLLCNLTRYTEEMRIRSVQITMLQNCRVEINNLMVLHDHPLIDYGKYALGCMTGADMKKCVKLKGIRDELLRSMEEKRQLMTNYRNM